jgi:hypothetical protein
MTFGQITAGHEAPELISIGAQSIVDRADSLGLTWGWRPATIVSAVSGAITAVYDNDTEAIGMFSLVPGLYIGARVMVQKVPPSGNYIVGYLDPGNGVFNLGGNISTQGTLITTAGAEAAVPSAAWDSEPNLRFTHNGVFKFHAAGGWTQTADQQIIQVSVRQGSGSTSGTFLWASRFQAAQNFASCTFDFHGYFTNLSATDIVDQLSLTITKVAGAAGNVSLSGSAAVCPCVLSVELIGTLDSLPSLVVDLITLT